MKEPTGLDATENYGWSVSCRIFFARIWNSQGHFEAERKGTPVSDQRRIFHLKRCRRVEWLLVMKHCVFLHLLENPSFVTEGQLTNDR
jgi:hypothetical protein